MDFDIGNILYVVITIVAIAASLLGKKKKKGAKSTKPGFLENLEKMLTMGQEEPVVMNLREDEQDMFEEFEDSGEEHVTEEPGRTNEPPSLMEEYERLLLARGGSVVESIQMEGESSMASTEIEELEDEEGTDYFEIVKDFDAPTAVVYSAIINRIDY